MTTARRIRRITNEIARLEYLGADENAARIRVLRDLLAKLSG